MALTKNQKRLLAELLIEKIEEDREGFIRWVVGTLVGLSEAQLVAALKQAAIKWRDNEANKLVQHDASRQKIQDDHDFYDREGR